MSETASGFSSASTSAASDAPLPRVFGRLVLLKLIARGGMGDIYLAATTGIEGAERPCVVKTIRRDHAHDGSFLARFLDEARVQSQLNHPGVAQVLEASTDDKGEPYTVVEYVEGRSLADLRQRALHGGARIGWPEACAIAIEIAQALAHVHERAGADGTPLGIVHRDLSPQNVMVGYAGEVKLIDFGTARGQNRRCHTVAGVVFAKPGYVAPEVARQQVGDARIDVYALGVMLWELVAGRRLLTGDAQRHLEEVAAGRFRIPALSVDGMAPAKFDEIVAHLTANDPEDRYPSAAVAANDLARLLATAPATKSGERSVRARVAALMQTLWTNEPARGRADFARAVREAHELRGAPARTPPGGMALARAAAASAAPEDEAVLPGTPYRLSRKIGEGASGVVYEAEHVELGRKLAVKVLAPVHASAHDALDRFRREARALALLSHPNLVALYDFGKSVDGRVFLAMELLDGETLDARVARDGALPWRTAARLGIEAARALEAAHAAGLVHRDLKPANLFATSDGGLKLLDFGVAMALADVANDAPRHKGFAIFGTPEYMAPEQVSGEAVDARCDVYALGCVLYELVTGQPVFDGSSSVVVMGKQLREAPESPRARAPHVEIPPNFEALILRALSKERVDRFASATDLREALERVLAAPKEAARRRRQRSIVIGASAAFALVTGVFAARWSSSHGAPFSPQATANAPAETANLTSSSFGTPGTTFGAPGTAFGPGANGAAANGPAANGSGANGANAANGLAAANGALSATNGGAAAASGGDGTSAIAAGGASGASAAPGAFAALSAAGNASASAPAGGRRGSSAVPLALVRPVDGTPDSEAGATRADVSGGERANGSADRSSASDRATPASPDRDREVHAERERRLADARTYARTHGSDVRALRTWAMTAFRAGELREARRAADAWSLHDGTAEPRLLLAQVLEASGRHAEANAVLEEWLEVHPDSVDARRLHARLGAALPPDGVRKGQLARR